MPAHDAAASAIGYLYQVRWALLALVRRSRTQPDISLTLELLDDVAFESGGVASELLQLKHHVSRTGDLGDKSVDVWKTLKVWMDGQVSRRPDGPLLTLVTTTVAEQGSAMALLRVSGRDAGAALALLDAAAVSSQAKATKPARDLWLQFPKPDRLAMLERTEVLDGQAAIESVDAEIEAELSFAAPFQHRHAYFDRVFEWWNKAAVSLLRGQRDVLTGVDLHSRLSDIRDFFRADNLPTLVQIADVDEAELAATYDGQQFLVQLHWVKANGTALRKAVIDYHRAVTQTTKWVDDSLIGIHEIQQFEDNLVDEWERAFANMQQDLLEDADDATLERAGRDLFQALSASTGITIRALYDEPFYARGKRHELADKGQLGWHPNFQDMFAALVGQP